MGYHTSDQQIDFFPKFLYNIRFLKSRLLFFCHSFWGYDPMTTTQRNEAPKVLLISDIFLCHSTCESPPSRTSFLAYIPEWIVNIHHFFPLFLAILAICFLFHISLPRSSCRSVCYQSFQSSSKSSHPAISVFYHLPIHRARIQVTTFIFSFFFFFFALKHPTPSRPYSSLHFKFTLFPATL